MAVNSCSEQAKSFIMVSESRKKLEQLERDATVLFHGSGVRILELEPRQAHTVIDGEKIPDGDPAVFASQFIDYAIFMALINRDNCPLGVRSSCDYSDGVFTFGATQETLDQLSEKTTGYVHVLHRSDFTLRGGSEWFSTKYHKPLEIIEVSRCDFTRPIELITMHLNLISS